MYCNQCGTKLSDDSKFCTACGKPTVAPAVETVEAPVEDMKKAVKLVKKKKTARKANSGEKKLFGKLPMKRLLSILGGVIVLILAIVLIFNVVEEKKRTTILGSIPDPEIFFGVSGKHQHYDYSWSEHDIEFEMKDVTKDMVDAYLDLLGSSEFPFVQDDSLDIFSGGRIWYNFKYNGSQELYDPAPNQIIVEFNTSDKQVVVCIHNSGNFELVPVAPYNSDNVAYESTAPEPQSGDPAVLPDFLQTGTDYEVSSSTTSHMKVYTEDNMDISAVETYLQQMQDMGYTIVYTEERANSLGGFYRLWEFAHSDVDTDSISTSGAQVIVKSMTYGEWDNQEVTIEFSDGISMVEGDNSQPTSSSGGGYVDCPSCYSGNCTACNGRKGEYSYSPGLDREWEECWKCRGTGKCSRCGGSGEIFG